MKWLRLHKIQLLPLPFAALLVFLAACSTGGQENPAEPEVTTLIYAKVSIDGVDWDAVSRFNKTHDDVQIEVRNYSLLSENGKHGMDLLMSEIAAGRVPDIIELGRSGKTNEPQHAKYREQKLLEYPQENCLLPYRQMAKNGYLEDLWPYIENDPDIGREKVVEAPLKAAEVDGGLYAVFDSVLLHTIFGAESVVGKRTSWTMDDMWEAFASMPEDAVVMDNFQKMPSMKYYLLNSYIYGFFDLFVDWETSECFFDSQQFRNVLELAASMPGPGEERWLEEDYTNVFMSEVAIKQFLRGLTMLDIKPCYLMQERRDRNFRFGGHAVPVGYPVEDGSVGAYFEPCGIMLAMSSTCQDKEAAWDYIRATLMKDPDPIYVTGSSSGCIGIPVNMKVYTSNKTFTLRNWKSYDDYLDGEFIPIPVLTQEEWDEWEGYFNSVTRCSLFSDSRVLELVQEEASAYFAGARTVDETAKRVQSRVQLYVSELK